jgi:hypothetical protein
MLYTFYKLRDEWAELRLLDKIMASSAIAAVLLTGGSLTRDYFAWQYEPSIETVTTPVVPLPVITSDPDAFQNGDYPLRDGLYGGSLEQAYPDVEPRVTTDLNRFGDRTVIPEDGSH